jgi:hypothetical protein
MMCRKTVITNNKSHKYLPQEVGRRGGKQGLIGGREKKKASKRPVAVT